MPSQYQLSQPVKLPSGNPPSVRHLNEDEMEGMVSNYIKRLSQEQQEEEEEHQRRVKADWFFDDPATIRPRYISDSRRGIDNQLFSGADLQEEERLRRFPTDEPLPNRADPSLFEFGNTPFWGKEQLKPPPFDYGAYISENIPHPEQQRPGDLLQEIMEEQKMSNFRNYLQRERNR